MQSRRENDFGMRGAPLVAGRSRGSEGAAIFVGLTVFVIVMAAVTGPTFPMIDSAFFEYIGRSLTHGRRLYADLWDNKLPSVYLVNALYWIVFGDAFRLHLLAETSVAAVTIGLFAVLARRLAIVYWAPLTFLYSLLHIFVGGPPNQTEHYAAPLLIGAVLLALNRRAVFGAVSLVLASTFWIPTLCATGLPIFLRLPRSSRVPFALAALASGVAVALALVFISGPTISFELFESWVSYEIGNYKHANFQPEKHTYLLAPLSPSFYTRGLGALLAIAATFWARDGSEHPARRFTLTWTVVTLLVIAALGKVSPHYFIPLYPPFLLLIGTFTWSPSRAKARWYFALPAIVLCAVTVKWAIDINTPDRATIAAIRYVGAAIETTYGPKAIGVLPWEMYLPSAAVPPSRFFLARVVRFAQERDIWKTPPDVYVDASDRHFNRLPPPSNLHLVCRNDRTGPFLVYSRLPIAALTCRRT